MFCKIDVAKLNELNLPPEIELNKTLSSTNDECHIDILNIGDKKCKDFAKSHFIAPNIYICCKGKTVQLDKENIENLINFISSCI